MSSGLVCSQDVCVALSAVSPREPWGLQQSDRQRAPRSLPQPAQQVPHQEPQAAERAAEVSPLAPWGGKQQYELHNAMHSSLICEKQPFAILLLS